MIKADFLAIEQKFLSRGYRWVTHEDRYNRCCWILLVDRDGNEIGEPACIADKVMHLIRGDTEQLRKAINMAKCCVLNIEP